MRTAIDTNILSALFSAEPLAREISSALEKARAEGGLAISAPVYAELLAHPKATPDFIHDFLEFAGIVVDFDIDETVWREAATRFARYAGRRRKSRDGPPKRLLSDFIIGAHALLRTDRLMTLDAGRYRQDFPDLNMLLQ